MGFPGNPQAQPVKAATESTLAKIIAAGRTPGMPAAGNNVDDVLGRGVQLRLHTPAESVAGRSEWVLASGCADVCETMRQVR